MQETILKALVVDDDAKVRHYVSQVLERSHFGEISTAKNGIEALEILHEKGVPHLIFLDVNMPRMNGRDFLQRIRGDEQFKHIPVIIMTAMSDQSLVGELAKLGILDFILKPIGYSTLKEKLKKIVFHLRRKAMKKNNQGDDAANSKLQAIKKVLLVDSDQNFLEFFSTLFSKKFFVVEGSDHKEGYTLYQKHHPDLVILGEGLGQSKAEKKEMALAGALKNIMKKETIPLLLLKKKIGFDVQTAQLFDGMLKKSFVPKIFVKDFLRVVGGGGVDLDEIAKIISEEITNDVIEGIEKTFESIVQKSINITARRHNMEENADIKTTVLFENEQLGFLIRLELTSQIEDMKSVANASFDDYDGSSEFALNIFRDLGDTLGGSIRTLLEYQGISTDFRNVEVHEEAGTYIDKSAKFFLGFATETEEKFQIGIFLEESKKK